jgi:hypothetical protein
MANRATQWFSPVFHTTLVQTGDIGDQVLQGTCNLFDHSRLLLSLSRRADISQEPTHEARIGTKQLESRKALATGLQEGMCA